MRMPPNPNPDESSSQFDSRNASLTVGSIAGAIVGAVLGAISFAQCLSTIGFFLDTAANAHMLFRIIGSAAGLLIGTPLGAAAGWLVGARRRRVNLWIAGMGGAISCAVFSSTLLLASGVAAVMKVMMPLMGLICGAILAAIVNVLAARSPASKCPVPTAKSP